MSQRASRRRWAARMRETPTAQSHCCNPCRDAKAKCTGDFPCARCFRNCLNCRSQPAGRCRGKGSKARGGAEGPKEGAVSFVEQAFQRSDHAAKAQQLLEVFQRLHRQGVVDRERAARVLRNWHYASLLADQDVTWGAGPAIADALRLTDVELLGATVGGGGVGADEDRAGMDDDVLPPLDAPDDVREAWLARRSPERGRAWAAEEAAAAANGAGQEQGAHPEEEEQENRPPPASTADADGEAEAEDAAPPRSAAAGRSRPRNPTLAAGAACGPTAAQRGAVPCYRVLDGTESPGLLALIPARPGLGAHPCATNAAWDRAYYSAARIRRAAQRHKVAPVLLAAALVGPEDRELWLTDYVAALFSARPGKSTNVLKLFNRKGNIRLYIVEFTPVMLDGQHGFVLRVERLPATRHFSDRPTEENEVTKKLRRRRPLWPSVYRQGLYDDPSGESDAAEEDESEGEEPQPEGEEQKGEEQQPSPPSSSREGGEEGRAKGAEDGAAPKGPGINLLPGLASILIPPAESTAPAATAAAIAAAAADGKAAPATGVVLDAATVQRLEALAATPAGAAIFRIKSKEEQEEEEALKAKAARASVARAEEGRHHARAAAPIAPMAPPPPPPSRPPLVPAFARAGGMGPGGGGFFIPNSGSFGGGAPMFVSVSGGGGFSHHHQPHMRGPAPGPGGGFSPPPPGQHQHHSASLLQQQPPMMRPRPPQSLSGLPAPSVGGGGGGLFFTPFARGDAQPPRGPAAPQPADPSTRLASLLDSGAGGRGGNPGPGPPPVSFGWPSASAVAAGAPLPSSAVAGGSQRPPLPPLPSPGLVQTLARMRGEDGVGDGGGEEDRRG